MRVALGLVVGALIAFTIACGSSKLAGKAPTSGGAMPTVSQAHSADFVPGEHHDEIAQLMHAIDTDLDQLQVAHVAPTAPTAMRPMSAGAQTPMADPTCQPATNQTCGDSCKLARSICDNAKKICEIADSLKDDAWANGKCTDSNTSCTNAGKKCCGCQ